jgi:hypothetical protein
MTSVGIKVTLVLVVTVEKSRAALEELHEMRNGKIRIDLPYG